MPFFLSNARVISRSLLILLVDTDKISYNNKNMQKWHVKTHSMKKITRRTYAYANSSSFSTFSTLILNQLLLVHSSSYTSTCEFLQILVKLK